MWTTNYRNSSRLWIHEFDNGYKVLTDLDLKENRVINKDQKVVRTITFDENYTLDDHNRFLQTIDEYDFEEENKQFLNKMMEIATTK